MKKLALMLAFTGLVSNAWTQTPQSTATADETVAWLKAHLPLIDDEFISLHGIDTRSSWRLNDGAIVYKTRINLMSIQSIGLAPCDYMSQHQQCVHFTGNFVNCRENQCEKTTNGYLFLGEQTSQADAGRILKALRHLIELRGNYNLPQEDLF